MRGAERAEGERWRWKPGIDIARVREAYTEAIYVQGKVGWGTDTRDPQAPPGTWNRLTVGLG